MTKYITQSEVVRIFKFVLLVAFCLFLFETAKAIDVSSMFQDLTKEDVAKLLTHRSVTIFSSKIALDHWVFEIADSDGVKLSNELATLSHENLPRLPDIRKTINLLKGECHRYSEMGIFYSKGENGIRLKSMLLASSGLEKDHNLPDFVDAEKKLKLPEYFTFSNNVWQHYTERDNVLVIKESPTQDMPFDVGMIDALVANWTQIWKEIAPTVELTQAADDYKFSFLSVNYKVNVSLHVDDCCISPQRSVVFDEKQAIIIDNYWFYRRASSIFAAGHLSFRLPSSTIRLKKVAAGWIVDIFDIHSWDLTKSDELVDLAIPFQKNPNIVDYRIESIPFDK